MSIKIAIVGATGYTGSELVRLLNLHPKVRIEAITSESKAETSFETIHPQFNHIFAKTLESANNLTERDLDAVFLALPHGISMEFVKLFKGSKFKIIDLSGDFRLSGTTVYESWYQKKHHFPEGFAEAIYGLPEINRSKIKKANLIANPGCYPTCSILGLAPLIKHKIVSPNDIIIDAKSGVTGAGIKPKATTHFSSINDNFKSYGLKKHRHTIEIEEQLGLLHSNEVKLQFTPHLLPVDRGILTTIYTQPISPDFTESRFKVLYQDFYNAHPFVRIRNTPPSIKEVRGTNYCDLFATFDERTNRIITIAVIDNLVKGAAGQAIQYFYLCFGLEETTGLEIMPLMP